jgi:hypothetical protein
VKRTGIVILGLGAGLTLGIGSIVFTGWLFVKLFAPSPDSENSSPPPEPFYFLAGALVGALGLLALGAIAWGVTRIRASKRRGSDSSRHATASL